MAEDQQTYRRATAAAVTGGAVQLALVIAMTLIGLWSQSAALHAATLHLLGGLPIWIILVMVCHQHRLERLEALEAEQLARRDAQSAAIFDEHADDLNLARRRLRNLHKWGLSIVSVGVAVYLVAIGGWQFYLNTRPADFRPLALGPQVDDRSLLLMGLCAGIAFVGFITARYVAGMTRVRQWQLLRGGAGYLMGGALVGFLAAVASLLHWLDVPRVFDVLGAVVPVLMLLIGVEIIVTLLLNAYRPRRPNEIARPAFDSRVLGLLTSPESIARAVSEAINYQFGFEISRSWFYQLLGRAVTPLVAFAMFVLILISSLIVVEPYEQAVVTRFGRLVRIDQPGLHFKWPWPIGSVEKYPVDRVHEIAAGSVSEHIDRGRAILWTTQHTSSDENYIITGATSYLEEDDSGGSTTGGVRGISLVATNVTVQFRIGNLRKFVLNVTEPSQVITAARQRQRWDLLVDDWKLGGRRGPDPLVGKKAVDPCPLLTALATRRVGNYFARHDIDTLLASGRLEAGHVLRKQIQEDVDRHNLGLDVIFVGLASIHPPRQGDVASAFHEQIAALQEKQAEIEKAGRDRIETLVRAAGSEQDALRIHAAIENLDALKHDGGDHEEQIEAHRREINQMLVASSGEAARIINEAKTEKWQRIIEARADAKRFLAMLNAHRLAPKYYTHRLYYRALAEGLKESRIFILPGDSEIRVNHEQFSTGIDDILNSQ